MNFDAKQLEQEMVIGGIPDCQPTIAVAAVFVATTSIAARAITTRFSLNGGK